MNSASLKDGASCSVVVSPSAGAAVFIASHMPAPLEGKVYQLWLADDGHTRRAGLTNASRLDQSVLMDGSPGHATGVGIRLEPAGGLTSADQCAPGCPPERAARICCCTRH
ncbi:hypothetical protein GTY60_08840 [Streptomyces sp. SID8367]|nr:hypothetical protein [Streptomyces sp. SID8367]